MLAAARASLMDDRQFLEELDNLETHTAGNSVQAREDSLERLDEGLPDADVFPRLTAFDVAEVDDETLHAFASDEEAEPVSARGQLAVLACGFVTLMIFGGMGAALVFHQRVADILALLR